ncbi:uncharacterized protein [Drosophila bipectinata]|uniref:uncharacterized protein n=1 Tax=Drosophila bipectinata TaxID=42026 RepID=UPI001C8990EE|nr:uncharacterized protein LOC122321888 [Drosophila bipectinata]
MLFLHCRVVFQDSTKIRWTNAKCISLNQSWVRINQCRLKAIKRDMTVFNFNATFLHPTKDIEARYRVFKRENGYKPWLINMKYDCCRFLRRPYDTFGIFIYKLYKDFSNINHTCPLHGDILIQGFYLRTDLFKLPMPTGDFLLSTYWYFYGKPQFEVNVSFEFIENLI